ncbi:MAG TPA: hypothetical protein VKO45_03155 [Methanomicrobiales archaeon]|nr:hypothetical protein [Methanomicrobiales archaeon]
MERNTLWKGAFVLAVTVLLLLLSGCSSTGGSTGLKSGSNSVVGTWKADTSQGATTAITVVTFRADGTGQYKFDSTTPGYSQMDWHISYPFTWRVTDESYAGSYVKAIGIVDDKNLPGPQFIYDTQRDRLTQSAQPFVRVS